jgi:hypothetical protein
MVDGTLGGTLNDVLKGIFDDGLEKNLDDEHSDIDNPKAVEYLETRKLYFAELNDSLDAETATLHRKREELQEWTKSVSQPLFIAGYLLHTHCLQLEDRIRATSLVLTELSIEIASTQT